MAEIKWIKIVTDIFDDEKILLIESLPEADSIIVCWFKLLCLAGKQNNSGVLMLNDRMPYTDEMLSAIFRRPLQTVRLAIETFESFGMIEIINGTITIPNWDKHQNVERIERLREYQKEYHREYRKKQAQIADASKVDSKVYANGTEEDKNRLEEDKNRDLTVSKETVCCADAQRVAEAWNTLGLSKVTKLVPGSQRSQMLNKRIKEYGVDEVLRAIENVRTSRFLNGDNKKGWQVTFDWFVHPSNFSKVLDGNYADRQSNGRSDRSTNNIFLEMLKEGES